MSELLSRVQAVRRLMPGVKLQEAKELVESGADEIVARHLGAAEVAIRQRVDAERRERIAVQLMAGLYANPHKALEDLSADTVAELAVSGADALMAALDAEA